MESEIEAAAERAGQWRIRCSNRTEDEHEYWENPALAAKDEAELVDWAVARLAADRAEREELARAVALRWPNIDGLSLDEWLRYWRDGKQSERDAMSIATLRGELIAVADFIADLLRVLKGGA